MGSVTEADIAHFREHGHVTIRRLLPRTDTERLVERLDGMLDGRYASDGFVCGPASRETPDDPGRFILQVMAARFPINDPVLAALSGNRRLRAAAAALMGSEHATVFQQQALIKGVDAPNATPWHQDDHYWQLQRGGFTAVTAWMPLRRTTAHGGTMWLLPGSHRHQIHDHDWAHGVSMFKTITGGVPEHDLIPLDGTRRRQLPPQEPGARCVRQPRRRAPDSDRPALPQRPRQERRLRPPPPRPGALEVPDDEARGSRMALSRTVWAGEFKSIHSDEL